MESFINKLLSKLIMIYSNLTIQDFWTNLPQNLAGVKVNGILGNYRVIERKGIEIAQASISDKGYHVDIEAILGTETGRELERKRDFRCPVCVEGINKRLLGYDNLQYILVYRISPVGEIGGMALAVPFSGGELAFPRRDVGMLALLSQTIIRFTRKFNI